MNKVILSVSAVLGFICLATAQPLENAKNLSKAELKAKIESLRKEASKYSSGSCWSRFFEYKWSEKTGKPVSRKKLDEFSDKGCALLKEISDLAPQDVLAKLDYANSLLYARRYAEAKEVYGQIVSEMLSKNRHDPKLAEAEFHLAETIFAQGDREGAKKVLKTLFDRNINTNRRGRPNWTHNARLAYGYLCGNFYNPMGLAVYSGSKPFPEPQRAEYTERFAPLEEVCVRLENVNRCDVRVELLRSKLEAHGIKCSIGGKSGYAITLSLDKNAPVDKPEGYTLEIGSSSAVVRARDRQGILWGVVSFVQCLSDSSKSVRVCKVDDWPSTARRGYLGGAIWLGCTEYTLFSKLNTVVMQRHPLSVGTDTPINLFICAELSRQFKAFGLDLYFGITNFTMGMGWAYTKPGALPMRIEICSMFAEMGANVYYPNDDCRYPVHKDDAALGLNASDVDAPHVLKIYQAVKKKYPDFKMVYCPPFYWGPDSSAAYPDDREKYLKSLRILPPELDIFWTGGQVKGYNKSKRQVSWYTELTGHKPMIFQNGTGPHNLLSYLADETDWNGWHYPGFFEEDISCFLKNSHTPTECVQITTLADCLWNVKGYDKKRSVKRALDILLGEKMYDILAPGVSALAAFDKYKYGELNIDILYEDMDALQKKYVIASNCWARAVEYNPTVSLYGAFGRGVGWAADVIRKAKNPPDFLAKYAKFIPAAREAAEKETSFDKSKGDLLYLPTDMTGRQMDFYNHPVAKEHRFVKFIRAANTIFSGVEFRFECDPFPPAGDYELLICGMDDEVVGNNDIEISVNGNVVYGGPSGFEPFVYNLKKFKIPFASMSRYNKVRISNKAYGANANGPPYIALAYALLRKTGEKN